MDSIFSIDAEAILSPYGEKYTHELELLTQMIDTCLSESSFHNDGNKGILISSLKNRININCTIEKYQNVLDDIEILQGYDVEMDVDLFLALQEAKLALFIQNQIMELEFVQNKYGHNFKSIIRNLKKSFNIKKIFSRTKTVDLLS